VCRAPAGRSQQEGEARILVREGREDGTIAPQRKLANEKPKGETVDYDTLIKSWPATPPKRAGSEVSSTVIVRPERTIQSKETKAGSDPGLFSIRHCSQ